MEIFVPKLEECHSQMRERVSHPRTEDINSKGCEWHQDVGLSENQKPDVLSAQHNVRGRPGNLKFKMILCSKLGSLDHGINM